MHGGMHKNIRFRSPENFADIPFFCRDKRDKRDTPGIIGLFLSHFTATKRDKRDTIGIIDFVVFGEGKRRFF